MVESSKILTVSYGTFSCTLEGFEDSFSTMKAIAEYFRDLAAEDRYFGAEPPTPDAEMLSRIAEREIDRRVEAQTSKDGIHLRAAAPALSVVEPAMPPEPLRPAAAPDMSDLADMGQDEMAEEEEIAAQDVADTPAVDEIDLSEDVIPAPDTAEAFFAQADEASDLVEAPAPLAEAPAHPDPSSVAAKLQRIRAVVGQSDDADPDAQYAEDITEAEDDAPEMSQIDTVVADDAPAVDTLELATEAEDAAADDHADQMADQMLAYDDTPAETDDIDPIDEDEAMADFNASLEEIEAAFDDEIEADDDAVAEAPADAAEEVEEEEEVAAFFADVEEVADADTVEDTTEEEVAAADETADETDAQITQVLRNLERAGATIPDDVEITDLSQSDDMEAAEDIAADLIEDTPDAAQAEDMADADEPAEQAHSEDAETMAADAETAEEEAPAKPTLRARILRVAKRDADADVDADTGFAEDDATEVAQDDSGDSNNLMADVMAHIAQSEEEEATAHATEDDVDIADEEPVADAAEDSTAPDGLANALDVERKAAETVTRSTLPATNDAEMSRIMEQADEELSNPESSRRRAAIAQLKAAVAATEAARRLGEDDTTEKEQEDAFRDDLSKVVRPRRAARPENGEARSERPRPAPLKLVASQRVDTAPAEDVAPVQPRRVSMSTPVTETDAESFADFAAEMGATELPDLLEAAAAYTAYVEGSEDFSRPQIMKKVQATTDQTFTREDGLRSFGTLLRLGRINKAGNGRFQISDQTRFKPEQKAG